MTTETKTSSNVRQAVPFFGVSDIAESLRFYLHGLGFEMMWVTSVADPDGYRLEFESYTDVPEETILDD